MSTKKSFPIELVLVFAGNSPLFLVAYSASVSCLLGFHLVVEVLAVEVQVFDVLESCCIPFHVDMR